MYKVIACTLNGLADRYLAVDPSSGGYPYWTDYFRHAQLFDMDKPNEVAHFQRELDEILKGKDQKYNDGTIYPNPIKRDALRLNDTKTSGKGSIVVFEINLQRTMTFALEGAIKKPTGFLYEVGEDAGED